MSFDEAYAMERSGLSAFLMISIASLVAIFLMTLFSYVVGRLRNKEFTEPVHLNDLLQRIKLIKRADKYRHPAGWVIHYLIGVLFVIGYHLLWSRHILACTLLNGAILGAVCGMIGIGGWHVTLSVHPNPPPIDLKEYYLQLFFAHVIFGLSATLCYIIV
jgi:hypothetical protein